MSRERVTTFGVVCRWEDRRKIPWDGGQLVLVVKADNANDALDAANAARPDLWANDGVYRDCSVYAAEVLA